MADERMDQDSKPADSNPFLSKEELIAHLKGNMFPKGKQFAPSLVMWGDPHGAEDDHDIDQLAHLSKPDEDEGV